MAQEFNLYKIQLTEHKKNVNLEIVTDIPNDGDINTIQAAVDNWIPRTVAYTSQSLVNYINSKGVHKAYTKQEADKLKIEYNV